MIFHKHTCLDDIYFMFLRASKETIGSKEEKERERGEKRSM